MSIRQELEKKLREYWDSDDFVVGVISSAKNEENWTIMLEFIDMAARLGDNITSDDLALLSLVLGNKSERKKSGGDG